MSVPADTNSADVLEVPTWYCMECKQPLRGEIDDEVFLAACRCGRKWYIQLPRRAGYYFEAHEKHIEPKSKDKVASSKPSASRSKAL